MKKLLLILTLLFCSVAEARPIRFVQKMSAPAFSPKSLSGLILWLDASDSTTITIATGVSQWNDKSGSGFNATQGTAARQPSYANTINGRRALTFDNPSQYYMFVSGSMLPNTMAVAWKSDFNPFGDYLGIVTARSSGSVLTSNSANTSGIAGVFATENLSGMGQTTASAYIDGVSVSTGNFDSYLTGSSASPILSAHTTIYTDDLASAGNMFYGIGVDVFAAARSFTGKIGEIIIYNRALTPGEISNLHIYLKRKWGTV